MLVQLLAGQASVERAIAELARNNANTSLAAAELAHLTGLQVTFDTADAASIGPLGGQFYDYFGADLDEARDAMAERYLGCYASLADYMQEVTEQSVAVPQQLAYYIDYEAMARDAEMSGDVLTIQTAHDEVHVFAGC